MRTLPDGWAEVRLSELGDWRGGGTPSKSLRAYWEGGSIPWVSPKDMKRPVISDAEDRITEAAVSGSATQLIPTSSVLIVTRSGILRHSLPVAINTRPVSINQDLKALTPVAAVSAEYIALQLRGKANAVLSDCAKSGTTVDSINFERLKEFPFAVAPLNEQRRIVAKIDSLSAKSARARDHLDHIPRLIEKYKQAVLAAAFRGDLTREWRVRHDIGAAWTASTVGQVAKVASGQTPKGIDAAVAAGGDVPWFKVSSMNEPGNLDGLRTSKFTVSRSAAATLGLRTFPVGSIAFPKRGGAIATNKKRKLLVKGALDLNIMVLTAERVKPDFLWWWMQKLDLASISNGSNVPQINNGDIEPLLINVPSLEEQNEIARLLDRAFIWIDRLAKESTSARKLVDHLDQAVLAKAFRGELVPQDPADEPASVLLERIRAERAGAPATKRRGRPRAPTLP